MIIINIEGFEDLIKFQSIFDIETFKTRLLDLIEGEFTRLYWIIQNDPNIPEDYKMAVFIYRNDESGYVGIGVFIKGKMKWLRFGKVLKYERYKCPVRKYFGGELVPAYTGPDYLKQLWEKEKDKIISNIRNWIINYFKR